MPSEPTYEVMPEVQDDILRLMATDPLMTTAASFWVKPHYFKDQPRRWMADFLNGFYEKYSMPPTKPQMASELLYLLQAKKVPVSVGVEVERLMHSLYDTPLIGSKEYTIDVIQRFATQRAHETAIMEALPYLERRDHEKVAEIMGQALAIAQMDIDVGGYWYFESRRERVRRRGSSEDLPVLPTGILELDINFRRGGVTPGEVGLWMAPKGGGKSIGLGHVARRAILQNWKVAYYSFEMSAEQTADRLDAGFSGVDMWLLDKDSETVLMGLDRFADSFPRSLMIKRYPNKTRTIQDIRRHLGTLKLVHHWVPQLIVIDYIGIVKPPRALKDKHLEMQEALEEFRALCIDLNCVGWTAAQINRSGAMAEVADGTHAAGSWDQLATADHIFTINQSVEDRLNRTIRILIDKIRDGRDHILVGPLMTDWKRMQFVRRSNKTPQEILEEQEAQRVEMMAKFKELEQKRLEAATKKKSKIGGKGGYPGGASVTATPF